MLNCKSLFLLFLFSYFDLLISCKSSNNQGKVKDVIGDSTSTQQCGSPGRTINLSKDFQDIIAKNTSSKICAKISNNSLCLAKVDPSTDCATKSVRFKRVCEVSNNNSAVCYFTGELNYDLIRVRVGWIEEGELQMLCTFTYSRECNLDLSKEDPTIVLTKTNEK